MGKVYNEISQELAEWISEQHLFFVATAPLASEGHVNTSPKGGDAFRVLGPQSVVYQDYTGSGAETVAHVRENGRIVVMFCAFIGPPRIVRLHGKGSVITPDDARFAEMTDHFVSNPGTRAFIHVDVHRVSSSCGFSVPFYEFKSHRDTLDRWATQKGPQELESYRATKNQKSIDGLPALGGKNG